MAYFLGIDSSTTGVKALLIDETGGVVGSATTELPISTPQPLWSEQDPADWWDSTVQSIRQALSDANLTGDDIAAIGLTGQMHGLTILDEAGEVLRPAMLWNDQRTGEQCDEIRRRLGSVNYPFAHAKALRVQENGRTGHDLERIQVGRALAALISEPAR